MSVGQSLLGVAMADTAAVGAQQHTVLVGVVAGVRAGVVGIMGLATVILMPLATMRHQWCTQLRQ